MNNIPIILALDIGAKRIGVAVSDSLGITAQGLPTIFHQSKENTIKRLKEIIAEREVKKILVGLPKNLDGSFGKQAEYVLAFVEFLKQEIPQIPIETWDERFSSQGAERVLMDAGIKARKRKEHIDKLAAQWILQGYLEYHRKSI